MIHQRNALIAVFQWRIIPLPKQAQNSLYVPCSSMQVFWETARKPYRAFHKVTGDKVYVREFRMAEPAANWLVFARGDKSEARSYPLRAVAVVRAGHQTCGLDSSRLARMPRMWSGRKGCPRKRAAVLGPYPGCHPPAAAGRSQARGRSRLRASPDSERSPVRDLRSDAGWTVARRS